MTESGNSGINSGGGDAAAAATSSSLILLNEAIHKVQHELLPKIGGHVSGHAAASELDFLRVKNETMITYLIELVAHLRHEALAASSGTSDGRHEGDIGNGNKNLMRLMEVKTAIDRTRNLEQKLRYQIDKLLVAADSHHGDDNDDGGDEAAQGVAVRNRSGLAGPNGGAAANDDPLEYRPNVGALLGDDDDDDASSSDDNDDEEEEESSSQDEDGDDDEEITAARRTLALAGKGSKAGPSRRHKDDDKNGKDRRHAKGAAKASRDSGEEEEAPSHQQLYRAPRLASVPYAGDVVDRQAEKAKRERQRLRAGEIATALRSRYTDAPDVDDVHGGADLGKQRETSRRWAQKQQDKTQYEESNMVRLTETRKDKKFKKHLMRQEMSNLSAIADLGSLVVRGLGNSGGGGGGSDDDDGDDGRGRRGKGRPNDDRDDGQRFSNGKRRRSEEGGGSNNKSKKKDHGSGGFQSSNALQAALFGGGRDGGGKKKKKGGRKF
jgi:U3 small nucleolar ribonucleoprotein protein LCP5